MEFLDIPIFNDDVYRMIFRFIINIIFLTIIIKIQYFRSSSRHRYFFTFYMIGIIVFLLCFTLKKYELDLGMALGLFAVFGIIRYRTDAVNIKEMTFLFIVIGISVINALANKNMSYVEIFGANILVVSSIYLIEQYLTVQSEHSKEILYEKIENIKPKNYEILKADLRERTGLDIHRVEIDNIDFLKDVAMLTIFYKKDKRYNRDAFMGNAK